MELERTQCIITVKFKKSIFPSHVFTIRQCVIPYLVIHIWTYCASTKYQLWGGPLNFSATLNINIGFAMSLYVT